MTTEEFMTILREYAENTGLALDDLDDAVLGEINNLACTLTHQIEHILHERMTDKKIEAFHDAFGE